MSDVQVIPLGGVGEIGKNCTVIRQGDDIVVIDCGLSFPDEEMLGVEIVVPDFSYLIEHKDKVRGVFITHAHEDHVGSLPYLLNQIKVPVYATEFTHALIRQKLEEKCASKDLILKVFSPGDIIKAGSMTVEPIRVTHSIPDTCSMAIGTKLGVILMTADFKFDFTPVDGRLSNMARFGELGREGVVLLLSDSTNVERPGWGPSESRVSDGLRRVFGDAKGRVLLTTFASNIHRMQQVYDVAAEMGRKVAVVGRRMEQNVETCTKLGYLHVPKGVRIELDDIRNYPPEKLAILTTGSQGEPMSALVQMSKEEYSRLRILSGDTLIYSARPIPGNEAAIYRTINRLFSQGVTVMYDCEVPVHVSGHAYQEELKMMINLTKPFYLAPVHGEPRHQFLYNKIGSAMGFPEHRLFTLKGGVPLCLDETKAWMGEEVTWGSVLVGSGGVPGVSDQILKERNMFARDGLVSLTISIDSKKGILTKRPQLQTKGVHVEDGHINVAFEMVCDYLDGLDAKAISNVDRLKLDITDLLRKTLQKRASIKPLFLVTVLED